MAIGVVAVVMMMIIPLPAFLLDALMALNLVLSLLIILIVLYTRHALEFSVFPTLLLVTTVFGLALNVSSTRLILVQGQPVRRAGHPGLRHLRGGHRRRAGLRDRLHHLHHHHRRAVHRHHQGRHPRRRGGRPLHPGRPARQADGHRGGVQLGPDHRGGGHPQEELPAARGGLLRGHGRRLQVRLGQRQGRHPHHRDQHHRRHHRRHDHPRRELPDGRWTPTSP